MPRVLFHFPQGVSTDVKTQLTVSPLSGQCNMLLLHETKEAGHHIYSADINTLLACGVDAWLRWSSHFLARVFASYRAHDCWSAISLLQHAGRMS